MESHQMICKNDILYRDNHVLAAVKPVGLLTQPSGTDRPNFEDMLKVWLKKTLNKPGNVYLQAVHRIDKDVSGIVLLATSSKALSRLNQSMRDNTIGKVYHALVDGRLPQDRGRLEHWLVHGDHRAVPASKNTAKAKKAILNYTMLRKINGAWLVEIELQTGRYHQIRAQLSAVRCSILGDEKYGSKKRFEGIALHSRTLSFPHPVSKDIISVTAPYPSNWPTAH
jgi:23S rRNA pseudouridine1911/1915/1917 synthase